MKMKRLFTLVLAMILVFSLVPVSASAAASGSCGENVTFFFDAETGILTISGEGAMENFYSFNDSPWYNYRTEITSVVIEEGVTAISVSAFYSTANCTSVSIPDSVTQIRLNAFSGCESLTEIDLPSGITAIGSGAFAGCSALKSITIPEGVTEIKSETFLCCESLAKIVIPTGVTAIGELAFEGCYGLKSITFQGDAPAIASDALYDVTATAYYPAGNDTWTEEVMQNYGGIITWAMGKLQKGPEVTASNVASSGKVKLSWNAVDGAAKYKLYRSADNKTWTRLTTTTSTTATNTQINAGEKYYYYVTAVDEKGNESEASNVVARMCDLARPALTLSNVASTGKIQLSWTAVDGAVKYQIQRSLDNKTWEHLAYTTNTTATNTKAEAGVTYYYKVRAIAENSSANSAYSSVKSRMCDLARPTLSITLNSAGKPKLSWNAIDGAVKYQIVRSTDNKNWEHLAYTTNTTATNTKAVAGTKYYYKVRVIAENTAANSAYSAVKRVTAK